MTSRFYHQNQGPLRGEVIFAHHHYHPLYLSHNYHQSQRDNSWTCGSTSTSASTVDNWFYGHREERRQYHTRYQHRRCSSSNSANGVLPWTKLSQNISMSTSQDARDVSDDRNFPPGQPNDRGASNIRTYRYESTADGDVVITDPAFDNVHQNKIENLKIESMSYFAK